jgi:hypothetical protein
MMATLYVEPIVLFRVTFSSSDLSIFPEKEKEISTSTVLECEMPCGEACVEGAVYAECDVPEYV